MPLLKVILLAFSLTLFGEVIQAGEPGTKEDVKVQQQDNKKPEQTATKKETVKQKLVNTEIQLPKNPIDKIFLQPLGRVLDPRYATITGNCKAAQKNYDCKVVQPKKSPLTLTSITIT